MLQLGQSSPLAPQISGLCGTDFAAWTLAAFTISRARGCPHPAHHSGHRRGHHSVVRFARRGRLTCCTRPIGPNVRPWLRNGTGLHTALGYSSPANLMNNCHDEMQES